MQSERVDASGGRHHGRLVTGLFVSIALLVAVGCGDDSDEPDSGSPDSGSATTEVSGGVLGPVDEAVGEPLRIGFIGDGQSAVGDNQVEIDMAEATVAYLNERRGGISGRPIELVVCTTLSDPAKGTDCANQMVEQNIPLVAVGTTGVYQQVWEPLHAAGIPTVFFAGSGDALLGDTENTFTFASPVASLVDIPIEAAEEAGVDKVTVVVIDVPAALEGYPKHQLRYDEAGIELELVRVAPGTADMTPALQPVISGDPGLIQIVGNDTFCISAYQALEALGFDGPITSIGFCISDATRQAITSGYLDGVITSLTAPIGEGEETALFRAVVDEYGGEVDATRQGAINTFVLFAGIDVALEGLEGDVTADSVIEAMRTMEESELPGAGGIRFRCDGNALAGYPAACTAQALFTTLDAEGQPTTIGVTG
jgi:ABC-type branched-subunit amino acid transport system substrate-binding protein